MNALDKEIEELVGGDRASIVEKHLAQNRKNLEQRLEMLIERARQRLAQHLAGTLPAKVAEEWASNTDLGIGLAHSTGHTCPACGDTGVLEGENVATAEPRYERVGEDDYDEWIDLTIDAGYFSCETCRLVLDNFELLELAGLPTYFADTGAIEDYFEPDYGND